MLNFFVEGKHLLLHTTNTSLDYSDNPFTQAIISNACEPKKKTHVDWGLCRKSSVFSVDSTSVKLKSKQNIATSSELYYSYLGRVPSDQQDEHMT